MVTLQKKGNNYNRQVAEFVCLPTDTKPLNLTGGLDGNIIENGSTLIEIDESANTLNVYMFDYENDRWIMI